MTEPTRVADLPLLEPRTDKAMDDHAYLALALKQGRLARDRMGLVYSLGYDLFHRLLDEDITRQIETEGLRLRGITSGPGWEFLSNSLLTSNGEAHQRRRTPLARTFAFPMMRALRPEVAAAAEALIAPLAMRDEVDVLAEIAGPFPAGVIARVLGVPETDVPRFTTMVYSAIRILGARSEDVLAEADASMGELIAYVSGLMAARRRNPLDDFLTRFLATVDDGRLSEEEIRVTIVTLILGGSDTTRAAMAATLALLLDHPEQWELLKSDPETWKGPAVEEGLRYEPSVGSFARVAVKPFELEGTLIPEGTVLMPLLLPAMRDPNVYAEPARFDITRTDHPRHSPAFGGGAHRCLGEALARVELEEALAAFARHWPDAKVVGDRPRVRGLSGTRGIDRLVVAPRG
ncbi:cytochrome P450 [Oceanicola sp. 22II-s10i]|uniref:cytochrome P450 n=1 Tax=Oceanicola sp. 22II-s10i TaxID=1317116 RepID=UPI001130C7CE|nr:cytochrome P450 [Oceanicola sp. 22II-s10i]